ncbi:hypothetical protein FHX42_005061 [Saccharopolyspora lacisalsi]|uniref:DUF385 domain-containing protein n=1 Tax=Halosaccharopolyspora lacisalsi TaxID=1000566 RepID=A0A839E4W8_9PSEU|nr:hypothetical protein [Halosaccharopolyspora lacisalsi]MBA8827643.1 hypothetical protein [Halosaccharopolyspora lacisalsi]MBA8827656.1 hypothetical protein [Halosaccharopolyspora lacisalsi]
MTTVTTAGRWVNKIAMPLVRKFSRWPSTTGRLGMAVLSYRGHRSGRHFSLVVGFHRTSDGIVIKVQLPDRKRWWRNFRHQRRAATLEVAGEQRTGDALATRDDQGHVHVHIDFD